MYEQFEESQFDDSYFEAQEQYYCLEDQPKPSKPLKFVDVNNNGKPLGTSGNLSILLRNRGLNLAVNSMSLEVELFEQGKLLDISYTSKRSKLLDECIKAGFQKSILDDHLLAVAEHNCYHPFKAFLGDGVWDGAPRVDPLIEAMNVKHKSITLAVMRKFFISIVASVYEPNFSSKLVPILQGGQSFRKTAFIKRFANIFEGAFLEGQEVDPDNKDSVIACIKAMIVEVGEFERTSKNSQGALKAFFCKEVDTVRPPYGRVDIKKPRNTSFIATVNGSGFLRDDTGSSRYAVIELLERIDMATVNNLLGWHYDNGRFPWQTQSSLSSFGLKYSGYIKTAIHGT